MDSQKQGQRKFIDKITVKKVRRGDFSPLQPEHYHNYFEVYYLLSGRCRFLLKDSVYHLEKGDLVFVAPRELHHSLYYPNSTCEIYTLYFKKEHLDINTLQDWIPTQSFLALHSFMGSIPTLYQDTFQEQLARMQSENAFADEYSNAFLGCYLQEIILFLIRHSVLNEKEPEMLNSKDEAILIATKYIYKNFRQPLTLETVSNVASLSPTYFSKKFKQVTGMGFKQYLNSVRLKFAQAALLNTTNSITDIALEYGFNDSNYFKDIFKKTYGKSPREFRKNPDS